jgi:hypothetical protein
VNLPQSAVRAGHRYFELGTEACVNKFCNIDMISIGEHSKCLTSLMENSDTDGCEIQILEEPVSCDIRRLSNATIVQAKDATVLLDSDKGPLTIPLSRGNLIVSLPGKLLCNSHNESETFILPKPMPSHFSSFMPGRIEVSDALNTSKLLELEARLSEGLKIQKRLSSLEFSDDRLAVNGIEFPTLSIIVCSSLILLGVQLLIFSLRNAKVMPALKIMARFFLGLRKGKDVPKVAISQEENIESPCLVAVVDHNNVNGEVSAELFHKETTA